MSRDLAAELDALEARFGAADLAQLRADLVALEPDLHAIPDVHVRALSDLGVVDHALGATAQAASWCERALAVDPNYAPALENLAGLFEASGDVLQAVALWRAATRSTPGEPGPWTGAARAAAAAGQWPNARAWAGRALALAPADEAALTSRAEAERMLALFGERPVAATPRLLIAVDRFHPSSGGSERLAEDAALALAELGWEVEIVTRALPERTEREHRGLPIHELEPARARPALEAIVVAGRFDAILAFAAPLSWPILEPLALRHPRPRVVVVPCVNGDGYADLRSEPQRLRRYAALLDGAHAVGHSSLAGLDRRACAELGIDSHYVPNAVHAAAPGTSIVSDLGLDDGTPLLLMVGNQWPEKDHLGLLAHLARHPDADVRVVHVGGASAEYPDLAPRIAAAAAADPRVVLAGPRDRAEIAALMQAAAVLLLPSKVEATPLVVLEAMSQRLPWIATPGSGAVHDHAGGVIAELERFVPVAQALLADPEAAAALGAAGREHWEAAYSWERVAERYDVLLRGDGALGESTAPEAAHAATRAARERLMASPLLAPPASAARISVVVTAYQYGRFVARCLDSILAQDHPAELLEVIVVDDGSTDDTAEVVARYGDAVRYIRQDNAGQIAATNRGLAEATGDYIILVDADDTIPADRVSAQAAILDARPEVGLVYGDMDVIDEDDRMIRPTFHSAERITPHAGRVLAPLLMENFMPGGTMMFRTADRPHYHPIGEHASVQDWWIGTCLAAVSEVAYVGRPMNHYRQHGKNDSLGASQRRTARLLCNDLRFRRWVLRTLDLSGVGLEDLVRALQSYDELLMHMPQQIDETPQDHAPVNDADRAAAHAARDRARQALTHEDAVRALVSAIADDPFDNGARAELMALLRPAAVPVAA